MGYVRTMEVPPYGVGVTVPTNIVHGYVRTMRKPKPGWWPDPILDFLAGCACRHDRIRRRVWRWDGKSGSFFVVQRLKVAHLSVANDYNVAHFFHGGY